MQKTIIATLELFAFDIQSLRTQYNLENTPRADALRAKYDAATAAAKYKTICNNINAYFAANYGVALA